MKIEIECDEMKMEDSFSEFIADTDSVSEIIGALLFRLKKAREEADLNRERWEECASGWNKERAARQAAEAALSVAEMRGRRDLGVTIGMDDYVPEDDAEYWSVEHVRKHIVWLEDRARSAGEHDALMQRHDVSAFREWLENRMSWACTNNVEWGAATLANEALARLDGRTERADQIAAELTVLSRTSEGSP